jgi:hypothetical protein
MLSSCPKSGDGSFDPLAITLPQGWLTAQGTGSDWPVRVSLRGATMTLFRQLAKARYTARSRYSIHPFNCTTD